MNIYDIAKEAGVSIATVSRVVNGSDKVSATTKEKVLAIIEKSDYKPNIFAQGLGSDTMHTIGILVPSISDMYMSAAVAHIESLLHDYGYDVILGCSGYSAEEKETHIKLLLDKRIDALMLVGSTYSGSEDDSHNTDFIIEAAKQKPVFLINGILSGQNIYCTASNDLQATYSAANHLLESGFTKTLFLTDSRSYSANQKLAGFKRALGDAGMAVRDEYIIHTVNDIHTVRDLLLGLGLSFDSVLATDDGMAVGAVKYAAEKGLRIPEDISIIGYNNSNLCVCSTPELTSIDNKIKQVCKDSVDRMITVLEGKTDVPRQSIVACSLVHRATTVKVSESNIKV